ncbi:class I SAM-dependent methyltransferase [Pseudonocardia acaciae]|uniref:class I SAM-dependent methyltransferase n=1 Tax=Pseudonocardia acaciae TaxID=551276 RepID=UPI00048B3D71|nr:class I SAM-dependent methyltransferase [Pseudonocardia acaciae]
MTIERANHWEEKSGEWITWARTPGHDAFWAYREQFREFVPAPGAATLDVGCGEGRISRELTDLGHHVTASDLSPSLLAAAEEAGSARRYRLADATALPFADGEFDRVVAYNMLMDVPDMPAAVSEAARVLTPGGLLTVSVVHPFVDRGRFDGDAGDAPFVVTGGYFESEHFSGSESRDGLVMHYDGWSHPLGAYTAALADAGFVITELREPRPARADMTWWRRLPLFLWINARRDG